MDIDNITDIQILRELAKRDRLLCINEYSDSDVMFNKGKWYLGYAHCTGGIVVYQNTDNPHYSLHKVFDTNKAAIYFDIEFKED